MLCLLLFLLFKKMYAYFQNKSVLHPDINFMQAVLQKIYNNLAQKQEEKLLTLTHFKTILGTPVFAFSMRVHNRMDTNMTLEIQSNVTLHKNGSLCALENITTRLQDGYTKQVTLKVHCIKCNVG